VTERTIHVTEPFLPPMAEVVAYLDEAWRARRLTNGGPLQARLEGALADWLGVPHLALCGNGTMALMLALRALDIGGEVITTPFSFAATTNALLWHGNQPVFADIDPETLNLDPARIKAAITPRTRAILPVHCYGNPCDMAGIEAIAARHDLAVLYDAAHAFGVEDAGGSILNRGSLSAISFHATKVFNTGEGGAVICHDAAMKARIDRLANSGIVDEVTVTGDGLNAKMSELHAALGLAHLPHMGEVLTRRARIDETYRAALAGMPGLEALPKRHQTRANHAYFPILVGPDYPLTRDALHDSLRAQNILTRRYFLPLLSSLPGLCDHPSAQPANLPVAHQMAARVLCLPIHPGLTPEDQARVIAALAAPLEAVTATRPPALACAPDGAGDVPATPYS
jgi:dTDP-4-amino-4,6-dideoxygalactose transaminase